MLLQCHALISPLGKTLFLPAVTTHTQEFLAVPFKFRLQDPHYHGPSDSNRILSENYVAWHGLDLFLDTSFYNFCIPQLPSV